MSLNIDLNKFTEILDRYEESLEDTRKDEVYKWEALQCFQEHWDIDAIDFAVMLTASLAKADNLLTGAMYYPASMIKELAAAYPDEVRTMFSALLDDSGELHARMEAFSQSAGELVKKLHTADIVQGKTINHHQNARAMSVYLFFAHPDGYYPYKAGVYAKLASMLGCDVPGNKYDKVTAYFGLLDELLGYVAANRTGLIEKSDEALPDVLKGVDLQHHLLMQDIAYFAAVYMEEEPFTISSGDGEPRSVHYWLISPGAEAARWGEFYRDGVVGLGWSDIGSITQYETREDITDVLKDTYDGGTTQKNNSLALWQFCHEMRPGDIIYAKKGRKEILGRGVVAGEYCFDEDRPNAYKNTRAIEWTHKGTWIYPMGVAPVKTLTDMTPYTEIVEKLEALFDDVPDLAVLPEDEDWPCYSKADFLGEVYLSEDEYDRLCSLLRYKKNIVLQGAPGVGKTFMAKRLAYSMMGCKDASRVKLVQFHQSYSYEDFIMGYRPNADGFELRTGVFYDFCKRTADDPDNSYFFIIDEINRGNLSKIFGELFMLIEPDKRGSSLQLLYANEQFSVPSNLYIIGMMNTADRSLAMMDFALRRRFAFYEVAPAFSSDGFRTYQGTLGSERFDRLITVVGQLNEEISADDALGRGFRIGHSYFCGMRDASIERLSQVVDFELAPLLEEYWYDEPNKAESWVARLRAAIG